MGTPKRDFATIALNVMKGTVALSQFAQHHLGVLKGMNAEEAKWT